MTAKEHEQILMDTLKLIEDISRDRIRSGHQAENPYVEIAAVLLMVQHQKGYDDGLADSQL